MRKRNSFNVCFTAVLTVGFVLLGVFVFNVSYPRVIESLSDLWLSVKFYFCGLFGIENDITPTVVHYSETLKWEILVPADFDSFKVGAEDYFGLLFSLDNFTAWGKGIGTTIGNAGKALTIGLPCAIVLIFALKRLYASGNTKHNKDTLPLKLFKNLSKVTYQPVKRFFIAYIAFLRTYRWVWICWAVMWAFHLNVVTIAVEFLAYYFYFAVSYRFDTLYVQVVKLFIDLQVVFGKFPWWLAVLAAYPLFERFRRRIALGKLRRYEARNCGFINELPIVSISCGSMGKKKTTMITDMTLSQEVMFRQKALEILQSNDMKFPFFPWICFEKELRKCMEFGTVYNLATVKEWVKKKRNRFLKHRNQDTQIYGYDYKRYGACYDDALKISSLFEVLETYAQAYFIYVIQSSLIVSNYSIRTDDRYFDEGNFPEWIFDFFPKHYPKKSRHAHILDFDVLRLGRKVLENNPNAGSFEFGVVAITEIGKERGNNLELREKKKKAEEPDMPRSPARQETDTAVCGGAETKEQTESKPVLTVKKTTRKELFDTLYSETMEITKRKRKSAIVSAMLPHFDTQKAAEEYVERNLERKRRNLIVRRIRCTRKANLQEFNYFVTFTYDDELHTEASFQKQLKNCLRNYSNRKNWRYMGVWERSPEKKRLHFHGLFRIPDGTMPGTLFEKNDYSFKTHKRQITVQNTYFNSRFGRCDFEFIADRRKLGEAMAYILKYIEKTGERNVYSKGMPQYFISDIMEEDVVCPIGMENKKLLLFDDFVCWDEGCLIGQVSAETIEQLRKSN